MEALCEQYASLESNADANRSSSETTVSARDAYAVDAVESGQNFGVVAKLTIIIAAKQVVVTKYITAAAPSLRGKPRLTPRLIYALESAEFISQHSRDVSRANIYLKQTYANFTYRPKNWTIIFNIKLYIIKDVISGLEIEGASCFDIWRDLHYRALIKRTDFNCCVITGWLSFTGIQCAYL